MSEHVCKTADDFNLVGTYNSETGIYKLLIQYSLDRTEVIEMDRDQMECLQDHINGLLEPWEGEPEQPSKPRKWGADV